jgi:hypothetical protein
MAKKTKTADAAPKVKKIPTKAVSATTTSRGSTRTAAPVKVAKKTTAKKGPKPPQKAQGPRHPKARVVAAHGGKEALAKSLAAALAIGEESASDVESRLKTASNAQLLRLAAVAERVKQKWGTRAKLIAAIGEAAKKSKDQDYLTKLGSLGLPQLVEIATRA